MPDYLDGAAKEMIVNMLGTTGSADDANIDLTYIRAVHELLKRYATENQLHEVTEDIQNMRQKHDQKAQRFYENVIKRTNRLGNAFSPNDILNVFICDVDDSIRAAVQQRYDDEIKP